MEEILKEVLGRLTGITPIDLGASTHQAMVVPDGQHLQDLERFQETPNRIETTATFHEVKAFVDYVNKYKGTDARVFVTPDLVMAKGGTIAKAYLDYHGVDEPKWVKHVALLVVSPSLEYKLLTDMDGKLMPQDVFAKELRNVARFCTSANSADLLDIARSLTLSASGEFETFSDDVSGSVRIGHTVMVSAKASTTRQSNIEVPTELTFNVPVLLKGAYFDLVFELKYRIPAGAGEKIQLGITCPDRKFLERDVLDQLTDSLQASCPLTTVAVGSVDLEN